MAEILRRAYILGLVAALSLFVYAMDPQMTGFTTWSPTGGSAELVIWDQTDSYYGAPQEKYTYPTSYETYQPKCYEDKDWGTNYAKWNIYFFANYTNSTNDPIDDITGNCTIRFDSNNDSVLESWSDMTYNGTSELWEYNRSFTYKGILDFEINCTSPSYDGFNLTDNVTIDNTPSCIFAKVTGYLPSIPCQEDTNCNYDFGDNITDDDLNDVLTYSCLSGCFSGFSIDPSTGIWTVLVEDNAGTGSFTVDLQVEDSDGSTSTVLQNITINAINDYPIFSTLPTNATEDVEFNEINNPESVITATDEEDNTPFVFNLTFVSCQKAHWISYPNDNCTLFNFTTSGTNITIQDFTPTNWDVGTYEINFTIEDNGTAQFGYNASNYTVITFTVENVNDRPNITSWNGTEIALGQGDQLYVLFNGTDIENDTLLFNATTMIWNESNHSYQVYQNSTLFPIITNNTYYPNVSSYGIMDYALKNIHVGNYTVNVTVTDNGTNPSNLTDYMLVNFTIYDQNDPPELVNVTTPLPDAVQGMDSYYYFNATDPDLDTIYSEVLTFSLSFISCETPNGTECDIDQNSTFNITKTGQDTAMLHVNVIRNDTGNYTLNITVTDAGGLQNWTLVNLTIIADEAPVVSASAGTLYTVQNQDLFYHFNVTDPENDTLNMTNVTLYRNQTLVPVNLFPVMADGSNYPPLYNLTMNYTPITNAQVGNYTVEINVTDVWNRTTTFLLNITVSNVNDPPQMTNFTNCDNSGYYGLNMTLYENVEYCIKLNRPDPDLYVPNDFYDENLTFAMHYINGDPLQSCTSDTDYYPSGNCSGVTVIDVDSATGEISFTATNETWHGNYSYNLTVEDEAGVTVWKIINITIMPVNDGPVFNFTEFLNLTADENFFYEINATDEENNTPFFFNVSFTCDGSPCTLFDIDNITGEINFTPSASQIGNYTANLTVTDSGNATFGYSNATGWRLSTVNVSKKNYAPTIYYMYPDSTFDMTEGQNKTFWYMANDTDNETLTCYWYINGVLITPDPTLEDQANNPVSNCNTSTDSGFWQYPVTYDDALNLTQRENVNMTLVVRDTHGAESNATVNMTVYGDNRAPRFNQSIQSEIKWYNDLTITPLDLDNYFVDDYGEQLQYSYTGASHIDVTIVDGEVSLKASGGWTGSETIVFVADDTPYNASSTYNASSNVVTLTVEYRPPVQVPVTSTEYRPKIASMRITVPEIVKVGTGNSSVATIVFYNDGGYDLHHISLNATTNETNISLKLQDTYIDELKMGKNFTTKLNISVGDLELNRIYLAYVSGDVESPSLYEQASVSIEATKTNTTEVLVEIVFVKDLFEENPECLELTGLIVEAEKQLSMNNIEKARELTKLALDNCQDMIDYAKLAHDKTPASQSTTGQILLNPFFLMGFVIALVALAMVAYWMMSRNQIPADRPKTIKTE